MAAMRPDSSDPRSDAALEEALENEPLKLAPHRAGSPLSPTERDQIRAFPERLQEIRGRLAERIVGQDETVRELMTAFFSGGHVLVVGVPGLAKTLMISSLAELMSLDFARIQFTPDLMPSDITGTSIIVRNETTGARSFEFRKGPIFTNLLLADEINRTPPKTQAALLEAMEEFQVTIGGGTHPIPSPFFVLATQNPVEQEGTYPLPITQLDRFIFQIDIDYPDAETEFEIVARTTASGSAEVASVLTHSEVQELLALPGRIEIPTRIVERAARLVRATRRSEDGTWTSKVAEDLVSWGAGPRAVQAILIAARGSALLEGRDIVDDADYEAVLLPALRHRVLVNYHAEAEKIRPDEVITRIRREIGDADAPEPENVTKAPGRFARLLRSIGDPSPSIKRR